MQAPALPRSAAHSYLLGCEVSGEALLIDPVVNSIDRDLHLLQSPSLTLAYTVDTHIHADHITAAGHLRDRGASKIAAPAIDALPCADVGIVEGLPFRLGSITLDPLHTPGHIDGHFAYRLGDRLFTGDALLIDGYGRTDFQNGDAAALYRSIIEKLLALPDEVLVYPGHDYNDRRVSSIGQEKRRNPPLGHDRTLAEFEAIIARLDLPYPKFIDYAVPGNRQCGVGPTDLPEEMREYCQRMVESPQG